MSQLKLFFLGPPRIELNDTLVELKRRKSLALLAYLALATEPQRRDTLATLLMPDSPQSSARAALRRDLASLNESLGKEWLIAERETIDLRRDDRLWIDVVEFQTRLAACEDDPALCPETLAAAADLYRADFLSGFTLANSPEFDDWQFFQTESLRQSLGQVLEKLTQLYSRQSDLEIAIDFARRWITLDPLHEPAHSQLMRLYAQSGQHSAALRQYEHLVAVLEEELAAPPSEETVALYEAIRTKQISPPATAEVDRPSAEASTRPAPSPPIPKHNLPTLPTPFIARTKTLETILQRLRDPDCRLLTLAGSGGIGKTRLAIQAARIMAETEADVAHYPHGIVYVSLVPINSTGGMVAALADALNFTFYRHVPPEQQLCHYLQEKQLLLVLDNFDHLFLASEDSQPGAIDFIADLLNTAPGIKILVTSRELLNLQEEWHVMVQGMRYPLHTEPAAGDLDQYGAIQLFVEIARRVQPEFSLTKDYACVRRICELAEGMPLAIELAAAWLKIYPCAKIAAEIESSFDFLTSHLRNLPERHRSIRAVFEYSWQGLSAAGQGGLSRLSVFQGGFGPEAAAYVARATLMDLVTLVEKSLLFTTADGRYQLHTLLQQFASEKLAAALEAEVETRERHSEYYLNYVAQYESLFSGDEQRATLRKIRLEIKNIQAAWLWGAEKGRVAAIGKSLESLYTFYLMRSRFQKGEEMFRLAVQRTQPLADSGEAALIFGKLLARQGAFSVSLGLHQRAAELLQQSLTISRRLGQPADVVFCLNQLGVLAGARGDQEQAKTLLQESVSLSREHGDQAALAFALLRLGEGAEDLGEYEEAEQFWRESLAINRAAGNQRAIAYSLDKLGVIAFTLGRYTEATRYYQESLDMFRTLGDLYGQAITLGGLAFAAVGVDEADRLSEVKPLASESIRLCREIGHRVQLVDRYMIFGLVHLGLQDYEEAQRCMQEALTLAQALDFPRGVAWAHSGLGEVHTSIGEFSIAKKYLKEAVTIALEGQFITAAMAGLFTYARLLVSEADLLADQPSGADHLAEKALTLLFFVLHNRAGWSMYKVRSAQLIESLRTIWPVDVLANAETLGLAMSLGDIVKLVLADDPTLVG